MDRCKLARYRQRIEINWWKIISISMLLWGAGALFFMVGTFQGELQYERTVSGREALTKVIRSWLTWADLWNVLSAIWCLAIGPIIYRKHREEPLLWFPVEKAALGSPRDYQRKAFLSWAEAIKQNSALIGKPLRDVHTWIREHGVTIDGAEYDPPDFPTWERYRRAGESAARSGPEAE